MLSLNHISKSFDGVKAVNDLTLEVKPSKITSFIGPNGAGKTTVFNIVTGFLTPTSGDVSFEGAPVNGVAPWRIVQRGMSRTFQTVRLFKKMSVLENILLGFQHQPRERFLPALITPPPKHPGAKGGVLDNAHQLMEFVGLHEKERSWAENLSYGQQKLLSIACCLATQPQMLLLDEPVSGVQPEMIKKIEQVIVDLVKNQGKTVFFIEHDMDFVVRVSDHVVVMDDGRLVKEGPPEVIQHDKTILDAYLS